MADKTTKTASKHKVFDIAKPGKLPAAAEGANARPVIVTNRPIMQDPMVVSANQETATAPQLTKPARTVIRPLSEQEEAIKPGEETIDIQLHTSSDTEVKPDEAAPAETAALPDGLAPASDEAVKDSTASASEPADAGPPEVTITNKFEEAETDKESSVSVDDQPPEGTPDAKKQAAEAEKQRQQAEIEQLIDEKTYFLPINAVGLRRSRIDMFLGLLLALLLGLILVVLMLDVGMLSIPGVKPFTNFF